MMQLHTINDKSFVHCDVETKSQQDSQHPVLRYNNFRVLLHNSVVAVQMGFVGIFVGREGAKGRMFGSGFLGDCWF